MKTPMVAALVLVGVWAGYVAMAEPTTDPAATPPIFPTTRGVLTHASGKTVYLADWRAGDARATLFRYAPNKQQWTQVGYYLKPPREVSELRGQMLMLSADGGEIALLWQDGGAVAPHPGGKVLQVAGSEGGVLFAIVAYADGLPGTLLPQAPSTQPSTQPSATQPVDGTQPASVTQPVAAAQPAATQPSQPGVYLLRRAVTTWELVQRLPAEFESADLLALNLLKGMPYAAAVKGDVATVMRWIDGKPELGSESLSIAPRVVRVLGMPGPMLWIAGKKGAGRLVPIFETPGLEVALIDTEATAQAGDRDAVIVEKELHLFFRHAEQRLSTQRFGRDGNPIGNAARVSLPPPMPSPEVRWWVNATIIVFAGLALLGALRRRPALQQALTRVGELQIAHPLRRLAAAVIDMWPLLGGLAVAISVVDANATARDLVLEYRINIIGIVSLSAYALVLTVSEMQTQRSIGKYLMRIKVADLRGAPPSPWSIVLRNLLRLMDVFLPLLLIVLFSPLRQRLADIAAGTLVVMQDSPQLKELPERRQGDGEEHE